MSVAEIAVEDKSTYDHVESAPEKSLTWERVKEQAERDEAWQHSLSLWKSLKVYKAVSTAQPPAMLDAESSLGRDVVSCGFKLHHHGILRHIVARLAFWPPRFQATREHT
jgi:hypothetical protein